MVGMMEGTKCTITDVKFKSDKLHPIIVSFQNGLLRPEDAPNFQCRMYNEDKNGEKRIFEMSSTDGIVYKGSEAPHDTKICRTLMAIRNKKTNNIRLIEVDSVQLAPVLPDDDQKEANVSALQDDIGLSTLHKTFGSKRIKRRTELRERMLFEVETMANQLNEAASGVQIAEEDLSVPSAAGSDSLIPCNRLASSVDEVYQLSDIISQYELDSMQEEAERILENIESCSEDQYSTYFLHYLKKLPAENKIQHLKMLLYAECLLKLYSMLYAELRRRNLCVCPFSEIVNLKIVNNFTIFSNRSRSRPQSMEDKILCHVIILGILGNNFTLDLEPLMELKKVKGIRVQELCQILGLVPASKTNKSVVVLKLPLPPLVKPDSKKKRKRR
ncbi:DNA-directed RNA polymerase I subunit RPA49 isoform X1 [Anabrus simplex]|uniref:DNA-directed RNA polymerase I subunit RPA49 isoform X1 n=1 Tax=Anabrus simplex TaxID=316456 RepID=UPI0035A3B24E